MEPTLRRTLSRSIVEGSVYALMVGLGEAYLVADVIRLGAGPLEVVLATTLPLFVGSIGAVAAATLLRHAPHRRPLVAGAAFAQALVVLGIAWFDLTGRSSPATLIASACLYHTFGQAAGTGWGPWFGEIVPEAVRGDYFSRRTGFVHAFTFVGLVVAGAVLHQIEPPAEAGGGGSGFALIFALAALFRLASAALLATSWEPDVHPEPAAPSVLAVALAPEAAGLRRLLVAGSAALLAVMLSSPFFAAFMLKELRFDYLTFMAAQSTIVAARVLSLPRWGRAVDEHGPRPVFLLGATLIALVPLPWALVGPIPLVFFAEAFSGMSWSAYEVSLFALLLDVTDRRLRPAAFAVQSVLNGAAQLAGGLLGAALFGIADVGYQGVFLAGFAARLSVALAVPGLLRRLGPAPALGRRALLFRMIGFRENGGPALGPVPEPPPAPPGPRGPSRP